jgi:hypothetical protein
VFGTFGSNARREILSSKCYREEGGGGGSKQVRNVKVRSVEKNIELEPKSTICLVFSL